MKRLTIIACVLAVATVCAAATRPVWPPGRDNLYVVWCACDDPICKTTWQELRHANQVQVDRRTRRPKQTTRPICPICGGWGHVLKIETLPPEHIGGPE